MISNNMVLISRYILALTTGFSVCFLLIFLESVGKNIKHLKGDRLIKNNTFMSLYIIFRSCYKIPFAIFQFCSDVLILCPGDFGNRSD